MEKIIRSDLKKIINLAGGIKPGVWPRRAWQTPLVAMNLYRGVAQLVAYYVRDVGAGSSSLLTPTIKIKWPCKSSIYKAIFISSTKSSTKKFKV